MVELGKVNYPIINRNILGANQSFRVNFENFNLSHQINIQGEERREVGGEIYKIVITDYPIQGRVQIVKLFNSPYPLDVDPMTQIEVSIVCMERLVCTWYVDLKIKTQEPESTQPIGFNIFLKREGCRNL